MANSLDDDLEFPEFTQEMIAELKQPRPKDLHLGPAEVRPVDDWWSKQYSPRPPSLFARCLDAIIVLLTISVVWIIIRAWIWVVVN